MFRYILKIKSSTKIPDFVQIRDEQFVLLGYVRLDRKEGDLRKHGLAKDVDRFWEFVHELPFGHVAKFKCQP